MRSSRPTGGGGAALLAEDVTILDEQRHVLTWSDRSACRKAMASCNTGSAVRREAGDSGAGRLLPQHQGHPSRTRSSAWVKLLSCFRAGRPRASERAPRHLDGVEAAGCLLQAQGRPCSLEESNPEIRP